VVVVVVVVGAPGDRQRNAGEIPARR